MKKFMATEFLENQVDGQINLETNPQTEACLSALESIIIPSTAKLQSKYSPTLNAFRSVVESALSIKKQPDIRNRVQGSEERCLETIFDDKLSEHIGEEDHCFRMDFYNSTDHGDDPGFAHFGFKCYHDSEEFDYIVSAISKRYQNGGRIAINRKPSLENVKQCVPTNHHFWKHNKEDDFVCLIRNRAWFDTENNKRLPPESCYFEGWYMIDDMFDITPYYECWDELSKHITKLRRLTENTNAIIERGIRRGENGALLGWNLFLSTEFPSWHPTINGSRPTGRTIKYYRSFRK
jgi:hypothetical protein